MQSEIIKRIQKTKETIEQTRHTITNITNTLYFGNSKNWIPNIWEEINEELERAFSDLEP